jgi:hypothetical protein
LDRIDFQEEFRFLCQQWVLLARDQMTAFEAETTRLGGCSEKCLKKAEKSAEHFRVLSTEYRRTFSDNFRPLDYGKHPRSWDRFYFVDTMLTALVAKEAQVFRVELMFENHLSVDLGVR